MKKSVILYFAIWIACLGASAQEYDVFDTSFNSPILDETKSMRIYLPPGYNDSTLSYPIVYYLHGGTGNYTQISQFLGAINSLINTGYIHPMLVVGLDGQCDPFAGSMYTNSILYGDYEDYIIQEAIPFAESILRVHGSADYRCIMGFAMGGYGSMKLAIKYNNLFAGIASYNGALQFDTTAVLWLTEVLSENEGPPYYYDYEAGVFTMFTFTAAGAFTPNLDLFPYQVELPFDTMGQMVDSVFNKWKEHDCSRLVKSLDTVPFNHPGLFFACGINDFLYFYPTNTCFADTLEELGIDHEFLTTNDGHVLSEEILQAGMYFLDSVMHDSVWVGSYKPSLEGMMIHNVFPNPFTTLTTIEYNLTQPETVTLTFYNQFGEQADRIEQKQSAGLQQLIWTPENLPSGIYYFRLQAGDKVALGKVIKMQ
jgi:S-formylglutathione hydrolase FrmB